GQHNARAGNQRPPSGAREPAINYGQQESQRDSDAARNRCPAFPACAHEPPPRSLEAAENTSCTVICNKPLSGAERRAWDVWLSRFRSTAIRPWFGPFVP